MRISDKLLTLAAGALALAASAATPQAGDYGCRENCYDAPSYNRTFKRRVELEPGVYEVARQPSLYGTATRRIPLDSGIEWVVRPAVYRSVRVRQHIRGRVAYEQRLINGRYVMCKIRIPGETVWTEKLVQISPARRTRIRVPHRYAYEERRILLRPYKNIAVYNRARHKYVRDPVSIQPEGWGPYSAGGGGGPAYNDGLLR
ncbi:MULTISPECIES: hypothetical protein [Rhodomicrobium]|uniref:hypothetical protein n=1 Tax=Rhodomicrobium TaxID=1068 RepID=UPI000F73DED4|nr:MULTISPECIES: hypothetical protein [Rhodomicrobium]